jgi:4-hydroxybenzoate polyprenyltransferase
MKNSGFLWNEFVYGGHWFSISASAIVFSIMLILEIRIRWELLLIVYLLLQCVYNYNHYKELHLDILSNSERPDHLNNYIKVLPIITFVYGFILFGLLLYFGNVASMLFCLLLLFLGLSFTNFFKKITKKIIGFKNYYASFTLGSLIIFTAIYCSYGINILLLELFVLISLRFLLSSSISDIKDIDIDKKQKLATFPIYFGKSKFLTFLQILNIITFIPFFFILMTISHSLVTLLFFTFLYTFYYIEKAKKIETDIQSLTNVIVDGEFIFWPFLIVIGLFLFAYC